MLKNEGKDWPLDELDAYGFNGFASSHLFDNASQKNDDDNTTNANTNDNYVENLLWDKGPAKNKKPISYEELYITNPTKYVDWIL